MSRIVSFIILIAIILVISVLFFRVMSGFWLPLFLAALLVVIFKPVHNWILAKCKGRVRLAAILTTLTILVVVLAPLAWAVTAAVTEAASLYTRGPDAHLEDKLGDVRQKFGLELPFAKLLNGAEYRFRKLQPNRDGDTPDWEAYDWLQARTQLVRLRSRIDALATQVHVHYDPKEAGLAPAEAKRRAALQIEMELTERGVEDLASMFAVEPTEPMAEQVSEIAEEVVEGGVIDEPPPIEPSPIEAVAAEPVFLAKADPDAYLELLNQAELRFRTFRQTLLGGTTKAWLIELANPSEEKLRQWRNRATGYIQHWLLSLTGQATGLLGSLIFGLCIMIISIYYFLIDGPTLIKAGMRLSPLDDQYELKLLAEFDKISRAVVLATLLSAIVQGVLATIGYFFVGANSLFLLFVLTVLLAMVPFVGAAAVWVPVCLWLAFVESRVPAAIGMGLWGVLVVSMADNLIKPWVLHGQSNLHPLLGLLSVLGGVQALGPIGILVGPMVVSFLQALLNIFQTELVRMERKNGSTGRLSELA